MNAQQWLAWLGRGFARTAHDLGAKLPPKVREAAPYVLAVGAGVGVAACASRVSGGLSPRRQRALELVAEVVPSQYPDARFAKFAPGYDPSDPSLPPGFTTCGFLPLYVGRGLGAPDGITRGGVEGLRIQARAAGAWVDADGSTRPRPGDFYGLCSERSGILVHVGIVVDASGDVWTTADAGQGPHDAQAAAYVSRPYDAGQVALVGPSGSRFLAGWLDLDAFPLPGDTSGAAS